MSKVRYIDDILDCRIKETLASATLAVLQMIAAKLPQFALKCALREGVLVPSFGSMIEFPSTSGECVTAPIQLHQRARRRTAGAETLWRWPNERLGSICAHHIVRAVSP